MNCPERCAFSITGLYEGKKKEFGREIGLNELLTSSKQHVCVCRCGRHLYASLQNSYEVHSHTNTHDVL